VLSVTGRLPLRAPRQDGAVVAEPPLAEVGALLAANEARLAAGGPLLGRPWSELRSAARQSLLQAAAEYHRAAGEPVPAIADGPLLMAGHQPELFHPGVWVKNFALGGLARRHGGVAVNLVVDNDTVKSTALRLPALTTDGTPWPHLAAVPFDHWPGEEPYEEAAVRDEALFRSFPERAAAIVQDWGFEPLLGDFWENMDRRLPQTPHLGERFARGRRSLERRWGCHNLEVPVSRVCVTEPFAHFACHLLTELPRFHALYNATVRAYRRRHGIRSRNHPVPDLAAEDGWLEVPFWAWRSGQSRRRRLLARPGSGGVELRAGGESWPTLPLDRGEPRRLVTAWLELERQGYKVRSRALTNTLYARLFLAELFVHGIGGGKYDELTDLLIRDFYHIQAPHFLVLSATLLLPLKAYPVHADDRRRLAREMRDLFWNPQRHLPAADRADAGVKDLLEQTRHWLALDPAGRGQRRERFRTLRMLSEQLRPRLADRTREVGAELQSCDRRLQANSILRRRDYPFCLYPEAALRPFCTRFLDV
jgi:hypothetical protein